MSVSQPMRRAALQSSLAIGNKEVFFAVIHKLLNNRDRLSKIFRKFGIIWIMHLNYYLVVKVLKRVFGASQAIMYIGNILLLAGGISLLSLVQLLLDFLRFLILSKKSEKNIREIPSLATHSRFHIWTEKVYHLKKDLVEFLKLSSIHGLHKLTGGVREKILWFLIISVAVAACCQSVLGLFRKNPQNQVGLELDDQTWSATEVMPTFYDFVCGASASQTKTGSLSSSAKDLIWLCDTMSTGHNDNATKCQRDTMETRHNVNAT